MRAMAATDRADAEPAAVSSIVAACGGVPLALSIAGARLAARPSWPLDQFAALLAAERGRLDELCYGRLSLRARLTATYRSLADSGHYPDQAAARALRLLGSWPVAAISTAQAAVLLGASPAEAAEALETLADASLLASPAPGQYLLHPLTRAFAADQAAPVPRLLRSSWGGDQARRGTCELPSSGAGVAWPWRAWRDVTPAGPAATVAVVGLLRATATPHPADHAESVLGRTIWPKHPRRQHESSTGQAERHDAEPRPAGRRCGRLHRRRRHQVQVRFAVRRHLVHAVLPLLLRAVRGRRRQPLLTRCEHNGRGARPRGHYG